MALETDAAERDRGGEAGTTGDRGLEAGADARPADGCGASCLPSLTVAGGQTVLFEGLSAQGAVTAILGATLTLESVGAASGFAPQDEVLLINLQGTSSDYGSTGEYELSQVQSVSGNSVTLTPAPKRTYGLVGGVGVQKVFLIKVPRFQEVVIEGTLSAAAWNGAAGALGVIILRALGKIDVRAGGTITASGLGFVSDVYACNGVSGTPGESFIPRPLANIGPCSYIGAPSGPNGGGGGGGQSDCNSFGCATQSLGAGGGGASSGGAGPAGNDNGLEQQGGQPGQVHGQADLSTLFLGSGGGAGAGGMYGIGGFTPGGRGGGLVYLIASEILVQGRSSADGQAGGDNLNCSTSNGAGSGGGGAGGCQGGGAGGEGRIRIDYQSLNQVAFPNGLPSVTDPPAYLGSYP